ncbi:YchJ family metal-binding protein [Flavobacterium sp. DG1-102-2]|uniref:YchJ family protein n=1 Tax=Flavobacterium sp. DG1-102-2 TaxID=3081663 RepID=UPI002949D58D|nr:YchJ family metal-binding protein [Flavobacterium sp. DG1-102-2]MDV6166876.1 YchJ family metal-binding protein [Flavobacterium sp. DG1-102-2]
MEQIACYCGSGKSFSNCCHPYISGSQKVPTAEALMRSRYSAYAIHNADYLYETTAPKERRRHSKAAILDWAESNQWLKLEVLNAAENTVEFKAYYLDEKLTARVHHEKSTFKKEEEKWYYVDGQY